MTQHVDIVVNEWAEGRERRVGIAIAAPGRVKIDVFDPDYEHLLVDEVYDPEFDTTFSVLDQDAYLQALARLVHNSYVFATQPHGDADCPFGTSHIAPMNSVGARSLP